MKNRSVSDNAVRLIVVLFAIFTIYVIDKMGQENPLENREACVSEHKESTRNEDTEQDLS